MGRGEDKIQRIRSSAKKLPDVAVFVYQDWPEPGFITGFTFGLSAVAHPDWRCWRPELMISVESDVEAWPLAVGHLANGLRGKCPFFFLRQHSQFP